jgi:hypothetical protein
MPPDDVILDLLAAKDYADYDRLLIEINAQSNWENDWAEPEAPHPLQVPH